VVSLTPANIRNYANLDGVDHIKEGELEAGETIHEKLSSYFLPTAYGTYTVAAMINSKDKLEGDNLSNNLRTMTLRIIDPNAPADLDVRGVTVNNAASYTTEQGEEFQVNVKVRNRSEDGASSNSTLRLYLSDDNSFDTADHELTAINIGKIYPGQFFDGDISLTLNDLGTYHIFAKVEDTKDINAGNDVSWTDPVEYLTVTVKKPNRLTMFDFYLKNYTTGVNLRQNGGSARIGEDVKIETMSRDNKWDRKGRLNQGVSVYYYFFREGIIDTITPENLLSLSRIGEDIHRPDEWNDGVDGEGNKDFSLIYPGTYIIAAFLNPIGEVPRDDLSDNIRWLSFTVPEANRLTMYELYLKNYTSGINLYQNDGVVHVGDEVKIETMSRDNMWNSLGRLDREVHVYYYFFPEGTIDEITTENLLSLPKTGEDIHRPDEWDDGTDGEGNKDFALTSPGTYIIAAVLNPIGEIQGDKPEDNIRWLRFTVAEANRLTISNFRLSNETTGEKYYENGAVFHIGEVPGISVTVQDNKLYQEGAINYDFHVYYYYFREGDIPEVTPENLLTLQPIGNDRCSPDEWGTDNLDNENYKHFSPLTEPGTYIVAAFVNPIGEVSGDSLADNIRYLTFTVE
jgi:hypothetical protein